ncbi:MAG: large subunit ribosomal protein [Clostridia bacterium]|nr:large subunit ribosomal protein [Clostridia bacterium]MDN5323237.1 large subunit ribosomal protein [Clostridia bacterium]
MAKNKLHVRKGDNVVVIAGKDKGKKGKVLQAFPSDLRVIVEGVNIIKKHSRPTQKMPQGGIVEREAPIHVSNVMPFCPKCGEGVRIRKKELTDGKRVRSCHQCGEVLDK